MATQATTLWAIATVKTYLGVKDTSKDIEITQIADAVTQRLEAVTHCVFVTRTLTEIRDGPGSRRLVLFKKPIATTTGFTLSQNSRPTRRRPRTRIRPISISISWRG